MFWWPATGLLTLVTVVVGGLGFAGCGAALRIEELNEIIGMVRRWLRR